MLENYRNKCEFSIGISPTGTGELMCLLLHARSIKSGIPHVKQNDHCHIYLLHLDKTVGFRLGGYKEGSVTVMEPTDCINIPQIMKDVTKVFYKLHTKTVV